MIAIAVVAVFDTGARSESLGPVSDSEWQLWYCGVLYQKATNTAARDEAERFAFKTFAVNFFKAASLTADPTIADIDTELVYLRRMDAIIRERWPMISEMSPIVPKISPPPEGQSAPQALDRCDDAANLPVFRRAMTLGMFPR